MTVPDRPDVPEPFVPTGPPAPKLAKGPIAEAMEGVGLGKLWQLWPVGVIGLLVVLMVVPRWLPRPREGVPPGALLAGVGLLVGAVGAALLAAGVSRLGLPRVTVLSAAAGAFCVSVAKFAFGPLGLYDANQTRSLNLPTEGSLGIAIVATGIAVLALYAATLRLLYALLLRRAGGGAAPTLVLRAVVGALGMAGLFALGSVVIGTPREYVEFVFSSIAAGGVAVSLVFAALAFGIAFGSAADRAHAAGNVGLYTAVFGLSMAFLVVFHVLWIVYLLTLAAIWPLKTVAPK